MKKRQLKRPSPGTALGLLALIVALAASANASSTRVIVRKGDIAKGAVTANALAKGAVHSKALAKGAVTAKAIKAGAVNAGALAQDAVTSTALAPGSVYGAALGPVIAHGAPMADLDAVAENGTWTASDSATATCGPGERLLTGGVVFTNPGNREVGVLESLPFSNDSASGYVGRITSNSGGTATAEVEAICLK